MRPYVYGKESIYIDVYIYIYIYILMRPYVYGKECLREGGIAYT